VPSLITSVIGGLQGSSAAHNAADAQKQGYGQAAGSVNTAVGNANPILAAAGNAAGTGVTNAATTAGTGATTAAGNAATGVNAAAGTANNYLDPYISSGSTATQDLSNLTHAGFHFDASNLANTPGYQFALQQGLRGVNAGMAAGGLAGSGAAMKAGGQFAEGLASSTYNQQYQNALEGYKTNVTSLLPGAQMGLQAGGTAGTNLLNAAQYGGSTGIQAAEYGGTAGMQGAQYAGNAGMWAGGQQASNLVNAGVYTGNTQIGSGNAIAQGDLGAASSWNNMLTGIGNAGNTAFMGGFGPGGGGWSPTNFGTNFGNMFSAGNYGNGNGIRGDMPLGYTPPDIASMTAPH
jgi:hypothetical protein